MPDMRGGDRFVDPHYDRAIKNGAAGCIFLARSTRRILLGLRSAQCEMAHHWSGFGGAIEHGETPDQTVRREIKEEVRFSGHYHLRPVYRHVSATFTYHNYIATVDEEFEPHLNWESSDAGWFDLHALPEPLHPGIILCLESPLTQSVIRDELGEPLEEEDDLEEDVMNLPKRKSAIDPALLTHHEYIALTLKGVPTDRQWHAEDAYATDVKSLSEFRRAKDFPTILRRVRKHGLDFVIRMRANKNHYVRFDEHMNPLRDEKGELLYYSDSEAEALGLDVVTYELAIFSKEDECVASFQDEWGCVLIVVASEYRGFGFGPLLTQMGRSIYPDKTSGGFTPSGRRNLMKVHRLFVSDALKHGLYRTLIARGKLTVARVKEIVDSVGLDHKPSPSDDVDLSGDKPHDWLLYADEYGCFIIYDKKLPKLLDDKRFEYFADKMIKGLLYVAAGERWGIMHAYGGDTLEIRRFLLRCGLAHCAHEDVTMLIDREELDDVDPDCMEVSKESMESGYWRTELRSYVKQLDYDDMAKAEKAFRKSFDRYDEFKYRMLEMAYAKFKS